MKQKIFFICSGLYEQSKSISVDLKRIDQRVRELKHQMTHLMMHRNPDMRPDEIEKIFHRYDHSEVNQTLEQAKEKYQTAELAQLLGKKIDILSCCKTSEEEEKAKPHKHSISQELYGKHESTSMLSKRSKWDGPTFGAVDETPSFMKPLRREESSGLYFTKTLSNIS